MNNRMKSVAAYFFVVLAAGSLWVACGDDPDLTGAACASIDECYQDIDSSELAGEVRCLSDNVPDGYCTHTCQTDSDCCAVEGECPDDLDFVSSSLENTNEKFCFLSCEGSDDAYCQDNVSDALTCRSSGGGAEYRKVCLP
jgi:hypothetical protein